MTEYTYCALRVKSGTAYFRYTTILQLFCHFYKYTWNLKNWKRFKLLCSSERCYDQETSDGKDESWLCPQIQTFVLDFVKCFRL